MSKHDWKSIPNIASSEITPEHVWLNRRNLMKVAAAGAGMTAVGEVLAEPNEPKELSFSAAVDDTPFKAAEDLTPCEAATTYNTLMSSEPINLTPLVTRTR